MQVLVQHSKGTPCLRGWLSLEILNKTGGHFVAPWGFGIRSSLTCEGRCRDRRRNFGYPKSIHAPRKPASYILI